MATVARIDGLFVTYVLNEWATAIETDDGATIPPGSSLRVLIYTPHDREVNTVKVSSVGRNADPTALQNILAVVEGCAFGDHVVAECGDKRYGTYQGYAVAVAK